ncbi:Aste57867_22243 [Aphanomyces stellatus]|uniref:Aste57867_22243 protein n=1 Tax=Aphanomyces stellatus TaxID=120398 RepID=A0A485LLL3_9STRA|nr:hypothetical protein As57867_022174 [Aphanomyces stellatus]VFT98910.1 Aste57867_22243 [Aphanomyces stellatus]
MAAGWCRPYVRRRADEKDRPISSTAMEMYHAKYDYVEDVDNLWDLTTDSTSASSAATSPVPPRSSRSPRRALSQYSKWGKQSYGEISTTSDCSAASSPVARRSASTDDLLAQLEMARAKHKIKATRFTVFADRHIDAFRDAQLDCEQRHVATDLIPLAPPPDSNKQDEMKFDGPVAKHKRIGELLGVAKPVGPWNTSRRPRLSPP